MATDARYEALVTILTAEGVEVTPELNAILLPAIQKAGYNSAPAPAPLAMKLKPLTMTLKPLAEDGKIRSGYALFAHTKFAQFKAEGVAGGERNQRVASEWKALSTEEKTTWKKGLGAVPAPIAPQPTASTKKPRTENKHTIFMSWALKEQSYTERFPSGSARLTQANIDWMAMGKEGKEKWVADFKAGLIASNPAPKKEKTTKAVAAVVAPVKEEAEEAEAEAEDEEETDE